MSNNNDNNNEDESEEILCECCCDESMDGLVFLLRVLFLVLCAITFLPLVLIILEHICAFDDSTSILSLILNDER